jgi:trimeric autotransporter adhesin
VTITSSNPGEFTIVTGGTCAVGQVIKVGTSCTVQVGFTPTGNGAKESTLSITQPGDPSWDSVNSSVHLTGTAANGALTADPETIDFGPVSVGQTAAARTFTVTNSGTLTTTIGTVLVSSPSEFPLAGGTCAGATLAPAATCTVSVGFKPEAAGSRSATMDVGGSGGASVSVALSGTGRSVAPSTTAPPARPALTASPSSLDFGTVLIGTAAAPQTITIRNTGNAATTPASTVTGAGASDFAVTVNGCNGRSLTAGASCTLTVAFSPTAAGVRSATVAVTGTGGASASARLSGTGQLNPVIAVSPGLAVPGQVLTAVGTNFPPGVAVTLAWDIGGPAVTTAADAAGSFSVAIVTPSGLGDGTRLLVVTAPPEATSARASVLLQPAVGFQGSASPAFHNSPASG